MDKVLADHLKVLFFALVWSLASLAIAKKNDFFKSPVRIDGENSVSVYACAGAFLVFIGIGMVIVPFVFYAYLSILNGGALDPSTLSLTSVQQGWFYLISITSTAAAIGTYILFLGPNYRLAVFGNLAFVNGKQTASDLLFGFATWFLSFPIVILISQMGSILIYHLLNHPQKNEQVAVKYLKNTEADPFLFGCLVVAIVLIVPIVEELLFRGFLQTWLKEKMGKVYAIIISSLIFAIFHYSHSQGIDNIELLSALFFLACFLGYIFERQQSLWAPIGLHSFFNTASVFMILNGGDK